MLCFPAFPPLLRGSNSKALDPGNSIATHGRAKSLRLLFGGITPGVMLRNHPSQHWGCCRCLALRPDRDGNFPFLLERRPVQGKTVETQHLHDWLEVEGEGGGRGRVGSENILKVRICVPVPSVIHIRHGPPLEVDPHPSRLPKEMTVIWKEAFCETHTHQSNEAGRADGVGGILPDLALGKDGPHWVFLEAEQLLFYGAACCHQLVPWATPGPLKGLFKKKPTFIARE